MTIPTDELRQRLSDITDRLVYVAGELMRRACLDPNIHEESCTCNTCRAFLSTQQCINDLETILKRLP